MLIRRAGVNYVTNSVGRISRGVLLKPFCQHCGKELKAAVRGRPKRFCNDTCRQAGYRDNTGKSSYAGTVRVKTAVPERARLGLPVDPEDKERMELHSLILQVAFKNKCWWPLIEVYHHKYGRGVLDLMSPWVDMHNLPYGASEGFRKLYGQWPNIRVWDRPRCRFRKGWVYLDDWKYLYILAAYRSTPPELAWINPKDRIRVRRSREIHVNLNVHRVVYNPMYGTMELTWQPRDLSPAQQALTESTGGNIDAVDPKPYHPRLDDFDSADADGD